MQNNIIFPLNMVFQHIFFLDFPTLHGPAGCVLIIKYIFIIFYFLVITKHFLFLIFFVFPNALFKIPGTFFALIKFCVNSNSVMD